MHTLKVVGAKAIAVVVGLLIGSTVLAAGTTAPLSTPELKRMIGSKGKPTLVFFQNPYGTPCRAQRKILDSLFAERKGTFNIAVVSSIDQRDQKAFYEYGIRSLPSLVLVNKNGTIARVFPPGIQSPEVLTAALESLK